VDPVGYRVQGFHSKAAEVRIEVPAVVCVIHGYCYGAAHLESVHILTTDDTEGWYIFILAPR
jgi:hypothetical protein